MSLNFLDKAIIAVNPSAAPYIIQKREVVAQYQSVTGKRRGRRSTASVANLEEVAQLPLAEQARYYDENFPVFKAANDELVKNVVSDGIKVNPTPKMLNGEPATDVAKQLKAAYNVFARHFCMDGRTDKTEFEQLTFRAFCRDGEAFNRIYNFGGHDFLTNVQLGFEPFECDHVPADFTDPAKNIHRGFKLGKYNRTQGIYYNADPKGWSQTPEFIPNGEFMHFANKNRLNSLRGFSQFAASMGVVADSANVQEATQLALKAATKITMVHKVGHDTNVAGLGGVEPPPMNISFAHSNVLEIGKSDEIKVFESSKGVGDTVRIIQDYHRQIVTSAGVSFSSTTGIYDGSYSAQRQELIDTWANYEVLRARFIAAIVRPCYEKFVNTLFIQNHIKLPAGFDISTLFDADFIGAVMPWIDPKKEAESLEILMDIGMLPLAYALAQRGFDITNILNQYHQDRKLAKKLDLSDLLALNRKVSNAQKGDEKNAA